MLHAFCESYNTMTHSLGAFYRNSPKTDIENKEAQKGMVQNKIPSIINDNLLTKNEIMKKSATADKSTHQTTPKAP